MDTAVKKKTSSKITFNLKSQSVLLSEHLVRSEKTLAIDVMTIVDKIEETTTIEGNQDVMTTEEVIVIKTILGDHDQNVVNTRGLIVMMIEIIDEKIEEKETIVGTIDVMKGEMIGIIIGVVMNEGMSITDRKREMIEVMTILGLKITGKKERSKRMMVRGEVTVSVEKS